MPSSGPECCHRRVSLVSIVTVVEESTLQVHCPDTSNMVSAASSQKRTGLEGHRAKMPPGCLSSALCHSHGWNLLRREWLC